MGAAAVAAGALQHVESPVRCIQNAADYAARNWNVKESALFL